MLIQRSRAKAGARRRAAAAYALLAPLALLLSACAWLDSPQVEAPATPEPGEEVAGETESGTMAAEVETATPVAMDLRSVYVALEDLSPAAAALAAEHAPLGVAVYVAESDLVYASNGTTPFPMASLVKIPIMLAALDRAAREDRELSEVERDWLERMIAVSDNTATSALWNDLGAGPGVGAYLRSIGVEGIGPASDGQWGDTHAAAVGVARLLAALASGEAVAAEHREYALTLLDEVVDEQRWGVSAAAEDRDDGTRVLLKNGWYPANDGWWLNSAGIVLGPGGELRYTIAVLSKEQPDQGEGIALIERIAEQIHEALKGGRP